MQFTSSVFAIAALSIGSAFAQADGSIPVHVVSVSNMAGGLTFTPSNLVAAVGHMVQFQFAPKNHSVVQSSFDNPCEPISQNSATVGIYSGFMPVAATAQSIPTYTIRINDTKPIWLYCSQGKHCQAGMSMVINENTKANSSRSLVKYQAAAAKVSSSGSPSTGVTDGTGSTIPSAAAGTSGSGAAATGASDGSGAAATGASGGSAATGTDSSAASSSTSPLTSPNAAASVRVSQGLWAAAALAGVVFALL